MIDKFLTLAAFDSSVVNNMVRILFNFSSTPVGY